MTSPLRFPKTLLFFLLASLCAPAVRAERKTVALGLVGGVTSTSYYGDAVRDFDFEIWPTCGFTLAFHLPAFLGVETDLLYVGKSGSTRQDVYDSAFGGNRKFVSTVKLHALEIPFMIKITAPTESEVQPIFFGGPSVAYFFSKKSYSEYIDIANGGTVIADEQKPLIEASDLVDYEWSICVGGGLEWGLGSFQLRFNLGQNTLDKTKAVDLKTFNAALMAGFIF